MEKTPKCGKVESLNQMQSETTERVRVTYHHLPSEELWDSTLHTCSFHLVLYIVQQLELAQSQNSHAHSI